MTGATATSGSAHEGQQPGTDFAPSRGFVEPYERVFANLRRGHATASDGTTIVYEVVGSNDPNAPVLTLANGLGGRLYSWLNLIDELGDTCRFISWDYRGLFDSAAPDDPRRLSIETHADDLKSILDAENVGAAHLFGWSMGVQVCLEFAIRHPERAASLVLINGTYGQVFSTAWQPFFPMPIPHTVFHGMIEFTIDHPRLLAGLGAVLQRQTEALFAVRKRLLGFRQSRLTLGLRQYVRDVFRSRPDNYLRLFQQLDAHSAYHLLGEIAAPTTVISGGLDYLTPARQSKAIASRIPGARHVAIALGTHYVMIERPATVLAAVRDHFGQALGMATAGA